MSVRVETCPVCDGPVQEDPPYGDIFSTPLIVIGAALVASAVAGYLAGSVVIFVASLLGGVILGFAWYSVPDHLGTLRRRHPSAWLGIATNGGPVVACAVAVLVFIGLGALVLVVAVGAFVLWIAADSGPFSRYEREVRRLRNRMPLSRDERLIRLARRYKAGELTSQEHEEIAADIRRRY